MTFQERFNKQIDWLLQGDPSIAYQTLRDLTDSETDQLIMTREKILTEGWGRELLQHQYDDGTWGGQLYSPKWISTFYSLLLLKRMGAPECEELTRASYVLLDRGFYEKDGGINYWKSWKTGECCVTAMLLSMLCHFGIKDQRMELMVQYLIKEQLDDGGWNCERPRGAVHSSFHTTISVLEGFRDFLKYHSNSPFDDPIREKVKEGERFLLDHKLYQSHRTGEAVDPKMIKMVFPFRWYSSILRCLDYFQSVGAQKDEGMYDAISLIKKKQRDDGLWKLEYVYPNKVYFPLEKRGKESRWITLMALRILKWWNT